MICSHCEFDNPELARYCMNCGHELERMPASERTNRRHSTFYRFARRLGNLDGDPTEFSLRRLMSQVFRRHSHKDAERLFIVGTALTTPRLDEVEDTWPKPWLFARVFLVFALCFLGLYVGFSMFMNLNFMPGLITIGSFMVPVTLLIFFWEMNAPQNIAFYKVIYMVFIGGVVSLVLSLFFYLGIHSGGPMSAGIVEETAKLLAVAFFLRERKHRYILNGMLIGAAVGTGFAAFETAGYAFTVALTGGLDQMYATIFWRGLLAPGGHVVWAALTGGALCMAKGSRKFRWRMVLDRRVLRMFIVVALLHALWNSPLGALTAVPYVQLGLTLLSWLIALSVMNLGLKEITVLKRENAIERFVPGSMEGRSGSGARI